MTRQVIFIDMDDTIVDFQSGIDAVKDIPKYAHKDPYSLDEHWDDVPGIFGKMKPIPGAVEAVKKLSLLYDVHILTTAPWDNPSAWNDKLEWIKGYFGENGEDPLYKKVTISHNKQLLRGSYLVDDRPHNGAEDFGELEGQTWIQIGGKETYAKSPVQCADWNEVDSFLEQQRAIIKQSKKCPLCGQKLLEIVYGMPGFDELDRDDVIFAGCIFDEFAPEIGCHCGYRLLEVGETKTQNDWYLQ